MSKRLESVAAVLLSAATFLGIGMAGEASAIQLEEADRKVREVRVTYVERVAPRAVYVELNNGATYQLRPCRAEDSRHCYWDASRRGNRFGQDVVHVARKTFRLGVDRIK